MNGEKVKGKRSPRWAFWTRMFIPCRQANGDLYLARLRIVQTPLFGIYLHDIYHPDVGAPHNHPWSFISIVMRGGYVEKVYPDPLNDPHMTNVRKRSWLSAHRMDTTSGHLIVTTKPKTKTLILVGPRKTEGWGFFDMVIGSWPPRREYIPWQEYEDKYRLPGSKGSGSSIRDQHG
jgi:hypothetical protein